MVGCTAGPHHWPVPAAGTCVREAAAPVAAGLACASLGLQWGVRQSQQLLQRPGSRDRPSLDPLQQVCQRDRPHLLVTAGSPSEWEGIGKYYADDILKAQNKEKGQLWYRLTEQGQEQKKREGHFIDHKRLVR